MANRTALEEQTGANLIYFNRTHGCFVMIKSTAMNEGSPPMFRWADGDKLAEEIARMELMAQELAKCPTDAHQRVRFSGDQYI